MVSHIVGSSHDQGSFACREVGSDEEQGFSNEEPEDSNEEHTVTDTFTAETSSTPEERSGEIGTILSELQELCDQLDKLTWRIGEAVGEVVDVLNGNEEQYEDLPLATYTEGDDMVFGSPVKQKWGNKITRVSEPMN